MQPVFRRILVPADFSEVSDRALDYAAALAGGLGASINLIHVLHDPFAAQAAWEFHVPDSPEVQERKYQDARSRLTALAASCDGRGVPISIEVRLGNPMEEINAAAVDYGSDLIVMSTHGRTGFPHLLLGSIAERVLRTAPCPVLALRQALAAHAAEPMEAGAAPAAR